MKSEYGRAQNSYMVGIICYIINITTDKINKLFTRTVTCFTDFIDTKNLPSFERRVTVHIHLLLMGPKSRVCFTMLLNPAIVKFPLGFHSKQDLLCYNLLVKGGIDGLFITPIAREITVIHVCVCFLTMKNTGNPSNYTRHELVLLS